MKKILCYLGAYLCLAYVFLIGGMLISPFTRFHEQGLNLLNQLVALSQDNDYVFLFLLAYLPAILGIVAIKLLDSVSGSFFNKRQWAFRKAKPNHQRNYPFSYNLKA